MSSVGWIDFSSEHRDKVRTVIDLLRKQGVVDELGIGVVRDSFADRMFPGVSTIQTRAKYFTLTALLIRDYERQTDQSKQKKSLEQYLEYWEKWCRIELARRYGDSGEGLGIIGITFGERKDRDVQRPPSSVYWNGMRKFNILRTGLSLSEYNRRISGGLHSLKAVWEGTDSLKGDDADYSEELVARVRVPEVSDSYWETLAITLTTSEAEFLRQQITSTVPDSLLGQILLDGKAVDQVIKLASGVFPEFAELPFIHKLKDEGLRKVVQHARDFWQLLDGAHIRYNCLLQDRFGTPRRGAELLEKWDEWREEIQTFDWSLWDTSFLWQIVEDHGSEVRPSTRQFVNDWIEQVRAGARNIEKCDRLVREQEKANKRGRARLLPNNKNERVGKWIGLRQLDYRLPQVIRIVEDIHRGTTGEADPDAGR